MDQFVLVPASVYNKSLVTQSVTKQELPKYQPSQSPTYQIDSLKKEIYKKYFSKADSLVDKTLSCPRIKQSNSQTLILDRVETGIFLSDFAQQLRRKNADVPDLSLLYLTPPVYLRLWFWTRMPQLKREEAESFSKSEGQKLQSLYTQGGAAYGSVSNLVKASNLPVSKVRRFLHSKDAYTKFTLATRKFKRMKAFARFKNETWCMDLPYVDKLAKDNFGVEYLLVRQDLFDRTVDAKGKKSKDSKETVRAFLSMITKKNRPKILGWQGNRICWRVWKIMQSWRNTNLLHNEWDQGCICWTYNTIPGKNTLPLHRRQWIQVESQTDSIRYNTKF